MNQQIQYCLCFLLVICLPAKALESKVLEERGQRLLHAFTTSKPYPILSREGSNALSLTMAYQLQEQWVERWLAGRQPKGFKAGVTNPAGQERFSLPGPVAGVLLNQPIIAGGKPSFIDRGQYGRLMIELELAFRVNRVITEPINDINTLKALVDRVMPAVELPDLAFESVQHANEPVRLLGVDIVAANVAAKHVIIGQESVLSPPLAVNHIKTELKRNNKKVGEGVSGDVMAGQWQALRWLINQRLESGYTITPKHVLITGAIGAMVAGDSGSYRADFGPLGEIAFRIH